MKNKIEDYNSSLMNEIFEEISPKEEKRVRQRMLLAAKIEDAMISKGWNRTKLLKKMGQKNPSVATKWFSGTHNFTTDTLFDLQEVLGVKLIITEELVEEIVVKFHVVVPTETSYKSSTNIGRILKEQSNRFGIVSTSQINSFSSSSRIIAEA